MDQLTCRDDCFLKLQPVDVSSMAQIQSFIFTVFVISSRKNPEEADCLKQRKLEHVINH